MTNHDAVSARHAADRKISEQGAFLADVLRTSFLGGGNFEERVQVHPDGSVTLDSHRFTVTAVRGV